MAAICAPLPTATVAATNAAQPASQPTQGPNARVAQVKVDPQSGVCLASSRNANAVSNIGRNPTMNSAGVLTPTAATMPASTAARL
jgi:hypothetical protein